MELLPFSPNVDSFCAHTPNYAKNLLADHKKRYLRKVRILQESYDVYQTGTTEGICFTFRDYGVRDIQQIGFTLIVETRHHVYSFQQATASITYREDNHFGIHIVDLQRIPIVKCSLVMNWISYAGMAKFPQGDSKVIIDEQFGRPNKTDLDYISQINHLRKDCINHSVLASSKKFPLPDNVVARAWTVYDELADCFSQLQAATDFIKDNHHTLQLVFEDAFPAEVLPVPINCYFDKGFYSTIYYAQHCPIIRKQFSGGMSALQCIVGVNKQHLDMLIYLFYCTIEQRNYFQYMTDEQVALQTYLEELHPVMRLRKDLENLSLQYQNASIVLKSDVFQAAQLIVTDYFSKLKNAREEAYKKMNSQKLTHGQWVNEYKLFTLIRVAFPDAQYQYSADWLDHQVIDIYIPSLKLAVEYHGEQHYQAVDYFGGEEKLSEQADMDQIKREKCQVQAVTLLEWPYSLQINWTNVSSFLHGNVPDEHLEYDRIQCKVEKFPIESLSDFFNAPKSKPNASPKQALKKASLNEIRKYAATGEYIASYASLAEAAEHEGLSVGGISKVIYGERRTAGGFIWKRCPVNSPIANLSAAK